MSQDCCRASRQHFLMIYFYIYQMFHLSGKQYARRMTFRSTACFSHILSGLSHHGEKNTTRISSLYSYHRTDRDLGPGCDNSKLDPHPHHRSVTSHTLPHTACGSHPVSATSRRLAHATVGLIKHTGPDTEPVLWIGTIKYNLVFFFKATIDMKYETIILTSISYSFT